MVFTLKQTGVQDESGFQSNFIEVIIQTEILIGMDWIEK